jgi:hypothetical protein
MITTSQLSEKISQFETELTPLEELYNYKYKEAPISEYKIRGLLLSDATDLLNKCRGIEDRIYYARELLSFLEEKSKSQITPDLLSDFMSDRCQSAKSKAREIVNELAGAE